MSMSTTQVIGTLAAVAAWGLSGNSKVSEPQSGSSTSTTSTAPTATCPITGQKAAGSKCPFSYPPPDPSHQCGGEGAHQEALPDVPPLTQKQKDIINATAPILAEHGNTITSHFYSNMLRAHPDLRDNFSESSQRLGHQASVLAASVHAYATHINDLTPILPVVQKIAYKHTSQHIVAQQYAIVGHHLIQSIVDILGDAVTPDIADAWYNGYWNLAKVFIGMEMDLYAEASKNGGWEGWRAFKVTKKVEESSEITSFYLEPVIGGPAPLPKFKPGQYTAVSLYVPDLGHKQIRQYSLSEPPNVNYFRISVKREDWLSTTTPAYPGWVSNTLHKHIKEGDVVDVASPYGEFVIDQTIDQADSPLVFLSAGVGQTALYSMLRSQIQKGTARSISYVTVARNKSVHAFRDSLRKLAGTHSNVVYKDFHSSPLSGELQGVDYDFSGRLSVFEVKDQLHLDNQDTQYYLCGPAGFMAEKLRDLISLGVDEARIHYEIFSAGDIEK